MRLSVADLKTLDEVEAWLNSNMNEEFSLGVLFSDLVKRLKANTEVKRMTSLQDWIFECTWMKLDDDPVLQRSFELALEEFGGEVPFFDRQFGDLGEQKEPETAPPEPAPSTDKTELPLPKAPSR